MIFTLLYSTPLFVNKEHRNIYLYVLGTVIYTIIHWVLFSSIGSNIPLIKTYRNLLYVIALCDIVYVINKINTISSKNTHKEMIVNENHQQNKKIICEGDKCVIPEENKPETNKKEEQPKNDKETTSTKSIPVYNPVINEISK